MDEQELLKRITYNPDIYGGKPIIRGRRMAVEHVLDMMAAGTTNESLLAHYPWMELDDLRACLLYAKRLVSNERVEPSLARTAS